MKIRTLLAVAPLAAVVACGGSSLSGGGSANLDAAVPTYAKMAMDQLASDTTAPAASPAVAAPTEASASLAAAADTVCHPRLFAREREVVERVNRHVYKALRHVERALATNPVNATETSKTWTKVEGNLTTTFTVTLVASNVYGWELAMGATGTTPLPVVMSGEIDRNGYTGAHEGKGTLSVDFAKLHAAIPSEKAASGTLEVRFDVSAAARKIAAQGTNVTWDLDSSKFDGGVVPAVLTTPRSGSYLYFREPGKGGSIKFQDQMIFLCGMNPAAGTSALFPATAEVVSRWYRLADGTVHGRSDGKITGGLTTPVASIVGVTCHQSVAEQAAPGTPSEPEAYWMMKAESAAGATVTGLEFGTASACDSQFGNVPLVADSTKDFTGWPASYFAEPPFPFPGM